MCVSRICVTVKAFSVLNINTFYDSNTLLVRYTNKEIHHYCMKHYWVKVFYYKLYRS